MQRIGDASAGDVVGRRAVLGCQPSEINLCYQFSCGTKVAYSNFLGAQWLLFAGDVSAELLRMAESIFSANVCSWRERKRT
jgi:hypothetical protein